jgi:ribonuclease T1
MARFPFPFPRRPPPYPPRRRVPRRVGIVGAIALLIAAIAAGISQQQTPAPAPSRQTSQPTASRPAAKPNAPAPATAAATTYETFDGRVIDDPIEVREIGVTLADIADGTPDRFRADREIYENRGKHLPEHPRGFWHAFTVVTPSENDRGPRRLVVGKDGSVWFTRDHYRTFVRLRVTTAQ